MGGWIMVPLAIMLLLAIYVFTERYIAIRNASRIDQNFMNIIRDHIVSGNLTAARSFAKTQTILLPASLIKDCNVLANQLRTLKRVWIMLVNWKCINWKRTSEFFPLFPKPRRYFGFVGTLIGLMQLFANIQKANEVEINVVSQGIYTKLYYFDLGFGHWIDRLFCIQLSQYTNR